MRPRIISSAFVVLAILGAVCVSNAFRNTLEKKHVTNSGAPQSTAGGISISSGSPSSTISVGNQSPQPEALLQQINNARATNGVAAVSENPLLDKAAQLKLADMISKSYFAHTAPDGTQWYSFITQAGYIYSKAGENLALGTYSQVPEQAIVNEWLNSPEHRANLLNSDYVDIGIGIGEAHNVDGHQDTTITVTEYGLRQ